MAIETRKRRLGFRADETGMLTGGGPFASTVRKAQLAARDARDARVSGGSIKKALQDWNKKRVLINEYFEGEIAKLDEPLARAQEVYERSDKLFRKIKKAKRRVKESDVRDKYQADLKAKRDKLQELEGRLYALKKAQRTWFIPVEHEEPLGEHIKRNL